MEPKNQKGRIALPRDGGYKKRPQIFLGSFLLRRHIAFPTNTLNSHIIHTESLIRYCLARTIEPHTSHAVVMNERYQNRP